MRLKFVYNSAVVVIVALERLRDDLTIFWEHNLPWGFILAPGVSASAGFRKLRGIPVVLLVSATPLPNFALSGQS